MCMGMFVHDGVDMVVPLPKLECRREATTSGLLHVGQLVLNMKTALEWLIYPVSLH